MISDMKYSNQKNSTLLPQNSYINKEDTTQNPKPVLNSYIEPKNVQPAEMHEMKSVNTMQEDVGNNKEIPKETKQENVTTLTPIEIPLTKVEDIQHLDPISMASEEEPEIKDSKNIKQIKGLPTQVSRPLAKKDFKDSSIVCFEESKNEEQFQPNKPPIADSFVKLKNEKVRKSFRKSTEKVKSGFRNFLVRKFHNISLEF